MSFEFNPTETVDRLSQFRPMDKWDQAPGAFDNFASGSGRYAMRTLAETGRAIDLLGSVGPILMDKFTGGTDRQDKYFKEHDDVFNNAVDFWTPAPNEVGMAGQVVGKLIGTLPQIMASPGLAIGATQLSTAEDLVKQGVSSEKAQTVGAIQGATLGLGIWMPVVGRTLTQRLLVGGAGANVVQGTLARGLSGSVLEGTGAEDSFKAFDPAQLTLDAVLGMAFGALVHFTPQGRAQSEATWNKIAEWTKNFKPSDTDALLTLRQAQHINSDSLPGKPIDLQDVDAHVQKIRQAIDQLGKDQPVDVSNMPKSRIEPDPIRATENKTRLDEMIQSAEKIRAEENVPPRVEPKGKTTTPKAVESGADPIVAEATRFAQDNPDMEITVARGVDGSPIKTTVKKYLDDLNIETKKLDEQAGLIKIAAECLLGVS